MAASEVPSTAPVFPLRANWRERVEVSYEYLTTVFESTSGREQRRGRRSQPRSVLSCLVSAMDEREQQIANRFVYENQSNRAIFPDYPRPVGADVIDSMTLVLDRPNVRLTEDAMIVLRSGESVQTRRINTVAGSTVTLQAPTSYTGRITTFAAIYGVMSDNLAGTLFTDAVTEVDLEVEALPGFHAPVSLGTARPMFDGREVFDFAFDRVNRSASSERTRQNIDGGSGRIAIYETIKFGKRTYRVEMPGMSAKEIDDLLSFFFRCKGRLKEFFMPTGQKDLTLIGSSGNTMTCAYTGQQSLATNRVDRAVAVYRKTGAVSYHKVTNYEVISGQARLTLSPSIGTLAPQDVLRVSWLPLCRFASDRLTVPYETSEAARIDLNVQTLEYLPAE